jgi:hypothetical protein
MNRFVVATLIALSMLATFSTSASAFKCVAVGTNGVSASGVGIFQERAMRFALRHCRIAGGVNCAIRACR